MRLKSAESLRRILLEQVSGCVKCGACMVACPLFAMKRQERAGMRGKIALLQAWVSGAEIPGPMVRDALSFCLGCQGCRVACPNDLDTMLVSLLGRHLLERNFRQRIGDWISSLFLRHSSGRKAFLAWQNSALFGMVRDFGNRSGRKRRRGG